MKNLRRMLSMLTALALLLTAAGLSEEPGEWTAVEFAEEVEFAEPAEQAALEEVPVEDAEEILGEEEGEAPEVLPEEGLEEIPVEELCEDEEGAAAESPAAPEVIAAPEWEYDAEIGAITIPYTELPETLRFEWSFDGEAAGYAVQTAPVPEGDAPEERGERVFTEEPFVELPAADYAGGGWFSLYVTAVLEDGTEIEGWKYFRLEQRMDEGTFQLAAVNAGAYDYNAAIQYSYYYSGKNEKTGKQHVREDGSLSVYNSAYTNLASVGGDCVNFVSQCLVAGGIPTTSGWYPYTDAWKLNKCFIREFSKMGYKIYTRNSSIDVNSTSWSYKVTPAKTSIGWDDVQPGDVIFVGSTLHALLVTRKAASGGKHYFYCSGHTQSSCGCPKCNACVVLESTSNPVNVVVSIRGGTTPVIPMTPVSGVTLNRSSASLDFSQSVALSATVSPANASNTGVNWTSSNSNVVKVVGNGASAMAWAIGAGTATVSCASAADSSKKASCTITVVTPRTLQITGVDYPATYGVKNSLGGWTLSYGTVYSDRGLKSLTTDIQNSSGQSLTKVTKAISGNRYDVRNFDANVYFGYVTRGGAGKYNWILTAEDQAGRRLSLTMPINAVNGTTHTIASKSAYAPVLSSSIVLSQGNLSMKKGESASIAATVLPDNAYNKGVSWSSSNAGVATVSGGTVRAVGAGTATITCAAADGSGAKASCAVTVEPVKVRSITLSQTELTLSKTRNDCAALRATVLPDDAENREVRWSIDDGSVAIVMADGTVIPAGAGTATVTCAAADGSGTEASCKVTVVEDVRVRSIELNKTDIRLRAGNSDQLRATALPESAANRDVTWKSSAPHIAMVTSAGMVTGTGEGVATITCAAADGSGVEASCRVEVLPQERALPEVLDAQVDPDPAIAGEAATLTVRTSAGAEYLSLDFGEGLTGYEGDAYIVRRSATESVWAVDFTFEAPGEYELLWSAGETSAELGEAYAQSVTVEDGAPSDSDEDYGDEDYGDDEDYSNDEDYGDGDGMVEWIELDEIETLLQGEATYLDAAIYPKDARNRKLHWESSDPSVVKINTYTSGTSMFIRAVGPGSATISCAATDGSEVCAECEITVEENELTKVYLAEENLSLTEGDERFVEIRTDPVDSEILDELERWAWNQQNASNKKSGRVELRFDPEERGFWLRGVKAGKVELRVLAPVSVFTQTGETIRLNFTVDVAKAKKPTKVSVTADAKTIDIGDELELEASLKPADAWSEISWSSSNKKIATVDGDGVVRALKAGSVTITAKAVNGGKKGSVKLKVVDPYLPARVELSESGTVQLALDEELELYAELFPETAQSGLTWSTSNKKIATVGADGTVRPQKTGTATITVKTRNGKKDSVKVKIFDPSVPVKVELRESGTIQLQAGEEIELYAVVTPDTAAGAELKWSSSNKKVASVDGSGVVTAKKKGSATITVKSKNGKKDTVKIKVS